ncbi:ribokinase, partial [Azospirillum sp. RWY-5-1]|nr:ribokinase [Azospirillum oleiclasticum]NYZ25200.1 ribokinase [Azospirillum oleiclasticum]
AAALDAGLSLPDGLLRAAAAAGLACRGVGAQDSMPDAARIAAAAADMPPVEAVG